MPTNAPPPEAVGEMDGSLHALKCWPVPFAALLDGSKTFEWRKDDRGYAVGDTLWIREWDATRERYTGREVERRITYILRGKFGVPDGYAVLVLATLTDAARGNDGR